MASVGFFVCQCLESREDLFNIFIHNSLPIHPISLKIGQNMAESVFYNYQSFDD